VLESWGGRVTEHLYRFAGAQRKLCAATWTRRLLKRRESRIVWSLCVCKHTPLAKEAESNNRADWMPTAGA
jgi:hypothetical protein